MQKKNPTPNKQLNKVWINGNLQVNAALTHGVRTLVRLPNDKGENRCWITFYDGRHDQAADSELVTYAGEWTSSHRLRGVAYVVIEHQWDDDLPEAFDYRFAGKGARFYDRRKDSTAGGAGAHRLHDPSTWEYSTNRMVVADHYRQGIRLMPPGFTTGGADPSIYWFGVGESPDVIPYDEFKDLADLCDEAVALKAGGSQKRYEVHGVLSADDDHKKNLEKLASGMAARAIDQGGRIVFRPIRSQSIVATLTDGDLSSADDTVFDPTGRIDDMVNAVEGRFIDASQNFSTTDYPRVVNDDYVAEDGGDLIVGTENADMDISGERAQRVATLKLNYSRRVATLEEVFLSSRVRSLKPGEWFSRESSLRGIPSGKTFEVDEIERRKDGTTKILAFEVDPNVDAWEASNAVDLSVPPYIPPSSIIDLTTPAIAVTPFGYTGGGAEVPAVRFDNANFDTFVGDEIVGEFGLHDGAGGISGQSATFTFPGNIETLEGLIGLPPATTFAIRFQARKGERVSAWSTFETFTTTGAYRAGTSGVADSFVGQNWGATASEAQASNARVPLGQNLLLNTDWESSLDGWGDPYDNTGLSVTRGVHLSDAWSGNPIRTVYAYVTGTPPNGSEWNVYQSLSYGNVPLLRRWAVRLFKGQRYYFGARGAGHRCKPRVVMYAHNSSGSVIASPTAEGTHNGYGFAGGAVENSELVGDFYTATENGWGILSLKGVANGVDSNPYTFFGWPMICAVGPEQTTPPPYTSGSVDRYADPTGENVAPAIVDQGPLATAANAADGEIG